MIRRYIFSFLFFIIPLILLIFTFRAMVSPNHYFAIPDMPTIIGYFSQIGNNDSLMEAVNNFNETREVFLNPNIYDLQSFFIAFANFFMMVGNFFAVIVNILAVPFRVLGWLFGLFA